MKTGVPSSKARNVLHDNAWEGRGDSFSVVAKDLF